MKLLRSSDWIFPGKFTNRPLSDGALDAALQIGLERGEVTVHGMRACFRTWVREQTSYTYELGELALNHSIGTKAAQAYLRGDALERRREMMEAWCQYCLSTAGMAPASNVVPLNARAK